jgi:rhodanese-related sulfurtransferase
MNNQTSPATAFASLKNENEDCILVDVRSAAEFNSLHAQPAVHIPLEQLTSPASLDLLRNKKVLCICQSGTRGRKAVETLAARGVIDAVNVEGGTAAWNEAGLPVIKGSSSISLERQVRIAAGSLVLIGSLAALTISRYFLAIPLFIGSGLLFSGITDTCGMATILARCPWNSK